MRISFKAHYYEIKPKSQHVNIKTDNNPYLGEKPHLVYKRNDRSKAYELPMKKNGDIQTKQTQKTMTFTQLIFEMDA